MPHHCDGFYHQVGSKIEVWFCVKGVHEYKPPDRTILVNGFISDHEATARKMIDEDFKARVELAKTILAERESE